ncbi:MAG TPA: glycosyltransferase, partial [Candidatus Elarobacter sp.]
LSAAALPYDLRGPGIRRIGRWYVLTSPRAIATALAYRAFRRLPAFLRRATDGLRMTLRRRRGFAHVLGDWVTAREAEFARRAAREFGLAAVLFDDIFVYCPGLRAPQSWIIAHDVKHQRLASFGTHAYRIVPRGFTEADERDVIARCGNVLAIQWDDAAEFRRMSPAAQVSVAPVTVDVPVAAVRRPVPGRCVFVASGALPNFDGLHWFLSACWPAIRRRVPAAELHVYGTVGQRIDVAPEGVRIMGVVDDLAQAYAEAAAALVPLRIGSGLKVKLVEAFCYGVPVVTTPVGVQGLGGVDPEPFLVGHGAGGFIDATIRVLSDRACALELERAGRAAAGRFAPETAFDEFDAALRGHAREVSRV